MEKRLLERFRSQVAQGQVILFTGAGFSQTAKNRSGGSIPAVDELRLRLWEIAFPGESMDSSSLQDIYECATQASSKRVNDLLNEVLSVDPSSVPGIYENWFSVPWFRVYTLNVDDLDEATSTRYSLPRSIKSLSALTDGLPAMSDELLSIHLNGRVRDYPRVTFSQQQYGERLAHPDPWYQFLTGDLMSKPVLFVGTSLDEPPFWQHLEMRRSKGSGKELRPGSYLLTPSLSAARKGVLEAFNIDWIQTDQETFATEVLSTLSAEKAKGLSRISDLYVRRTPLRALQSVAELRTEKVRDLAEFLMGREPTWADITEGFAVIREFEKRLWEEIQESKARVVVITGTAGTGKSTTLRRLALEFQTRGKDVRWLNSESEIRPWDIPRAIEQEDFDVLVLDDLDIFGEAARTVLEGTLAKEKAPFLLLALRTTRYKDLDIASVLSKEEVLEVSVPLLENGDIEAIIDSLDSANRLGVLKGMSKPQRIDAFKHKAGRQLLVAMIEATSGRKLEEKIASECSQLTGPGAFLYAIVAVATSLRGSLEKDELLLASNDMSNEQLNEIQQLINQHLLLPRNGDVQLRHRVVADKAVEYYRSQGQLYEPIRGLIFALATKVRADNKSRREGRLLIKLTNHEWLSRHLSPSAARHVYDTVENLLSWDFHYWLQRGSLEVEQGDLQLAENFLQQARSLRPDDYKVQTEWAYMMLKQSIQEVERPESYDRAAAAFGELEIAISGRGSNDPYPYHVIGSQGLAWVRRAKLSTTEKIQLLEKIRSLVKEGTRLHSAERGLVELAKAVDKEYLMMAVSPEDRDSVSESGPQ